MRKVMYNCSVLFTIELQTAGHHYYLGEIVNNNTFDFLQRAFYTIYKIHYL